MRFARRACVFAVLGLVSAVHAEEPKTSTPPAVPEADDELLEFLGSVDMGDEDWIDYLSQTDIAKVAKEPEDAKKEGAKK